MLWSGYFPAIWKTFYVHPAVYHEFQNFSFSRKNLRVNAAAFMQSAEICCEIISINIMLITGHCTRSTYFEDFCFPTDEHISKFFGSTSNNFDISTHFPTAFARKKREYFPPSAEFIMRKKWENFKLKSELQKLQYWMGNCCRLLSNNSFIWLFFQSSFRRLLSLAIEACGWNSCLCQYTRMRHRSNYVRKKRRTANMSQLKPANTSISPLSLAGLPTKMKIKPRQIWWHKN
jgi:hypothetical protein